MLIVHLLLDVRQIHRSLHKMYCSVERGLRADEDLFGIVIEPSMMVVVPVDTALDCSKTQNGCVAHWRHTHYSIHEEFL